MRRGSLRLSWILVLAVVMTMVVGAALVGCGSTSKEKQPFTIGVSAPLSGTAAARGKYIKDGTSLAAKQINDAGGVNGIKLELKFEDNEGNPTKTASTVQKLLEKDQVKALVVADSTGTYASIPLVDKAGAPMFTTAFSPGLTEKGSKYVFRCTVSDAVTGPQVMDFVVNELGYKKVAILASDSDYGQGAAVAAAKRLEELGCPAVVNEKYKESDRDFSSQLLNVQQAGAEVLFIHSLDASAALVTKQAREMGLTLPVVGATGLASEQYRDLAGAQNVEGVYAIVAFANSNPDPLTQQFVKDFEAFAGYKPDHNTARAHAAVMLIAEGLKAANSVDPQKVSQAIHGLKDVRLPGGTFTFDDKGEGLRQNVLGQWRSGKFEFVRILAAK